MTKEKTTIEIELSEKHLAREVGYGILHRAGQLHNNPDDDMEWAAEELKEVAWEILDFDWDE